MREERALPARHSPRAQDLRNGHLAYGRTDRRPTPTCCPSTPIFPGTPRGWPIRAARHASLGAAHPQGVRSRPDRVTGYGRTRPDARRYQFSQKRSFKTHHAMRFSSSTSTASIIKPTVVTERLCDMPTHNVLNASEIRNRAREFKCSMVAARRETKLAYRSLQNIYSISFKKTMFLNFARLKHRIRLSLSHGQRAGPLTARPPRAPARPSRAA